MQQQKPIMISNEGDLLGITFHTGDYCLIPKYWIHKALSDPYIESIGPGDLNKDPGHS